MATSTHDFPDESGKAVPYGIYDLAVGTGWINVGTDYDTAAFAVESIRRWWNAQGQLDYPAGPTIADHRRRGRLQQLPHPRLENRAGRPGRGDRAGDHRMPLPTRYLQMEQGRGPAVLPHHHELAGPAACRHEVIVASIAATTTRTGLRVHAELDTNSYPKGIRIPDQHMDALPLTRHDWHGDWNYTLRPEPYELVNTAPDPFDQSVLICWYARAGTPTTDITEHRNRRPWYTTKRHASLDDMLIAFRRARITIISPAHDTRPQTPIEAMTCTRAAA